MPDQILIHGLEVAVRIGVPDAERAGWQTVRVDLELEVVGAVEELDDDIERTVDYEAVTVRLRALGAERPRRLIETLAAEMAACLLSEFPVAGVSVVVRKRVLPGVDHVAVRVVRRRLGGDE